MSATLKPQFYITRQTGDCVPLIALDELPWNINLRGVPRTLAYCETPGMMHVGSVEFRGGCYEIAGRAPPAVFNAQKELFPSYTYNNHSALEPSLGLHNNVRLSASHFGRSSFATNTRHEAHAPFRPLPAVNNIMKSKLCTPPSSPIRTVAAETSPECQVQTLATRTSHTTQVQAATNNHGFPRAIPGKKEYCSYWLRHGECDYQQQGCLYKHEMPTDMVILQRLGLREIPRWYRELHNIGANHYNGTSSNSLSQSDWAPKRLNSPFSGGVSKKENWRFPSERPAGSRQSTPLTHAKTHSFSPPTRQFKLPAKPPSPPEFPPHSNAGKDARAESSTPRPTRLGSRIAQLKARNAEAAKASMPAANTIMDALKGEKSTRAKTDEPVDHLPSFPALVPTKKEMPMNGDKFDEDEEMIG